MYTRAHALSFAVIVRISTRIERRREEEEEEEADERKTLKDITNATSTTY